ncbi:MAG TPA: NAD(P)H-dependent oxidoreductase [Longimicrobiaceae bacterium]|nr:NAD(P)H-dependent oxidoreductase [Longimicrobiaceae bacterium]
MPDLQIIVTSTRPSRRAPAVAAWFSKQARAHRGFDVSVTDLAELDLPLFDEPQHPRLGKYEHEHTRRWSGLVDAADAFVFVTPEYNYGTPPALVNAIDFLSREWAYKPAGFVSYGGVSAGTRSVQMTKQLLTTVRVMPIPEAVAIPFFVEHLNADTGEFEPGEAQEKAAAAMLDELLRWTGALQTLRQG